MYNIGLEEFCQRMKCLEFVLKRRESRKVIDVLILIRKVNFPFDSWEWKDKSKYKHIKNTYKDIESEFSNLT